MLINPTEQVVKFMARCSECGKYYEITVDIAKKLGEGDGRIVCCSSCKRHPVLYWISPYSVREVRWVDYKKGKVVERLG